MKKTRHETTALIIILIAGFMLPAGVALGGPQENTVAQVKADFDAAMAHSLDDRITALESLEQEIDNLIFDGTLTGESKSEALYYKFHTQQQSAKYPESCQTYASYIQSIKEHSNETRAHSTFLADAMKWKRQNNYTNCASICKVIAEECTDDPDIVATALYYEAFCKYWMNGTKRECMAICERLIAEYPDSAQRPEAMRLLANAHAGWGEFDSAVGMLALLEEQYPHTQLAHYADMKVASYYEYLKGDPQTALEVYQQSLIRYPDHVYAPYIHREIEHLQTVIEEQLIQDALDGIVKANTQPVECETKSLIVRSDSRQNSPLAARLDGSEVYCLKLRQF
jgi:TolA-binding protein